MTKDETPKAAPVLADDKRTAWIRPEVQRMRAGDAEDFNLLDIGRFFAS